MLICRNAEGEHGQRKVENPWLRVFLNHLALWPCLIALAQASLFYTTLVQQ